MNIILFQLKTFQPFDILMEEPSVDPIRLLRWGVEVEYLNIDWFLSHLSDCVLNQASAWQRDDSLQLQQAAHHSPDASEAPQPWAAQ